MNLDNLAGLRTNAQPKLSRAFNGVWIPASLWLRKDITWFQKCLLSEIASFETCSASNGYLAEAMGSTEGCIAKEISNLRKKGLILDMGFNGRQRWIVVAREAHPNPHGITEDSTQPLPYGKPSIYPAVNIDTSVEQRRDSNQTKGDRRRTLRVSAEEKDRMLREEIQLPPNAPTDQELAEILSRFPLIKKWRGEMFWHLKGTKFHHWNRKRKQWEPIKHLVEYLNKLETGPLAKLPRD